MAIRYGMIEEVYEVGNCKRVAYGIAAYADAEEEGSACILHAVRDLSSSRASVEALSERLNREEASIHHLDDIVADFLTEES